MAVSDHRTIRLPGRSTVFVPVIGTKKNNELSGISKATREWTVTIDPAIPDSTELYGFSYNTTRETVGHAVNQLIANAATRLSDLIIIIQNATYSPVLEQYMNDGTMIPMITIQRWGWINSALTELDKREFGVCYVTQFRQILDYLVLFIRPIQRDEKILIFGQNGESKGQAVSSISATTGISSVG
ncbi:MAG: hypothetical protein LBR89_01290 [Holosporales bacterium]|jgi:hypothetical protein|nr:hypothetical protein [Holosporales bacterium]